MIRLITQLWLLALSASVVAIEAGDDANSELLAGQVAAAALNQQSAPLLAAKNELSFKQAYQIQTMAVKQQLGKLPLLGFKAGLTTRAAQQKFGVVQPVAGVLLGSLPEISSNGRFSIMSSDFIRPMLEAEIGFRLNRSVSEPVTDIEQLKTWVREIRPVVEVPDLSFAQPGAATGLDIVVNNVMAKQVIAGTAMPLASLNINAVAVSVYKNKQLVLTGKGSDVLGDQWLALQWLINQTLVNGWKVGPEHLLITGALGKMLPAGPGDYRLDYGSLGVVEFSMLSVE